MGRSSVQSVRPWHRGTAPRQFLPPVNPPNIDLTPRFATAFPVDKTGERSGWRRQRSGENHFFKRPAGFSREYTTPVRLADSASRGYRICATRVPQFFVDWKLGSFVGHTSWKSASRIVRNQPDQASCVFDRNEVGTVQWDRIQTKSSEDNPRV